jgi:hypothetical protein
MARGPGGHASFRWTGVGDHAEQHSYSSHERSSSELATAYAKLAGHVDMHAS